MAAIFSGVDEREPEPHLRVTLFSQIERVKAYEEQMARLAQTPKPPAPAPTSPSTRPARAFAARLWAAAGSYAVVGVALFAVLAVVALVVRPQGDPSKVYDVPTNADTLLPIGLSTIPVSRLGVTYPPTPVATKQAPSYPRTATKSATARVLDTGEGMLELQHPIPVAEQGNPADRDDWHVVRDPAAGYSLHYPPNWWTGISGNTRAFYPWGPGGTRNPPYWLTLDVEANPRLLNAESANAERFNGTCRPLAEARGSLCRRDSYLEGDNQYDELYAFDRRHIYALRLTVPVESALGEFAERWEEAQSIFSRMSASLSLPPDAPVPATGYAPLLFINNTDLWIIDAEGNSGPVTRGYGVLAYSLAPDLRHVAFLASNDPGNPFPTARYLYLADLQAGASTNPRLLWSGDKLEMFDLAWYGDREIVVVATGEGDALALYKVALPRAGGNLAVSHTLLVSLDRELRGVRGLAVSPDRQLITFLAPLGEQKGTSLYAVRPDGSELLQVLSFDEARPPAEGSIVQPENQAIKSYVWTSGHLEYDGYLYKLLFTDGDSSSPNLIPGGYLYSAPGHTLGPLLDPSLLPVDSAEGVQIVHLAHSAYGKVAFTGFYRMRDGRAEVLAGLWIADLKDGRLTDIRSLPSPAAPRGIADLQWSPDGSKLIYRETIPQDESDLVSRYEKGSGFLIVQLDPRSFERVVLFDGR
jgi:hypothetical protein